MDELLDKAANGKTLKALYEIIKQWVLEQIESGGGTVDSETIKTIVNEVFEDLDILTREETITIVNNAIESVEHLTEERVQEMIDESVGKVMEAEY